MSADKVKCPFDPVHVVEKHKLIYHLSRCVKTYKGGQHTPVHCPLDYSHVVQASELEQHVRTCPQLALAVPLFNMDSESSGVVTGNLRMPQPPSCINELVTGEWEVRDDGADEFSGAPQSDLVSEASAWGAAGASSRMWGGRGRVLASRGAAAAAPGRPDEAEYRPGDVVPGGYVLRDLQLPPGFGPRGRFELRGSI